MTIVRHWLDAMLLMVFASVLSGCTQGIPEFQNYVQAFNIQNEQGDAILDSVAQAERTLGLSRHRPNQAVYPNFDPNDAAYFIDTVDPPATAAIRASLRSLKSFNDSLGALASGEAAAALTGRVGTITSNLTAASAALGPAGVAVSNIAGGPALIENLGKAVNPLLPIFQQVATLAARESFRQQLIEAHPHMKDLLVALRDGTPAMFEILKLSHVNIGAIGRGGGLTAEGFTVMEANRRLLSGWVVLMNRTLAAMDAAEAAAKGDGAPVDMAKLTDASVELRVLAGQIRAFRNKP